MAVTINWKNLIFSKKYGSKCLLELQVLHNKKRRIILRKHRSLPEEKGEIFEIVNDGIAEIEKIKKEE